jgi:hypothetical protein
VEIGGDSGQKRRRVRGTELEVLTRRAWVEATGLRMVRCRMATLKME